MFIVSDTRSRRQSAEWHLLLNVIIINIIHELRKEKKPRTGSNSNECKIVQIHRSLLGGRLAVAPPPRLIHIQPMEN